MVCLNIRNLAGGLEIGQLLINTTGGQVAQLAAGQMLIVLLAGSEMFLLWAIWKLVPLTETNRLVKELKIDGDLGNSCVH